MRHRLTNMTAGPIRIEAIDTTLLPGTSVIVASVPASVLAVHGLRVNTLPSNPVVAAVDSKAVKPKVGRRRRKVTPAPEEGGD